MARFKWIGGIAVGMALLVTTVAYACQTVGLVDSGAQVDFVVEGSSTPLIVDLELRKSTGGVTVEYYDGSGWNNFSSASTVQGSGVRVNGGSATVAFASGCGGGGGIIQPSDE